MKKLILILFFVGVSFGQVSRVQGKTPVDTSVKQNPVSVLFFWNEADSLFYPVQMDASGNLKVSIAGSSDTVVVNVAGATLNADSLFIKPPTGLTSGTKSVTTSASVIASSADAQEVWIINDNSSGVIYFGGSGVTTSNGVPIYPKTVAVVRTDNIADVYVIAGSTLTARYLKVN